MTLGSDQFAASFDRGRAAVTLIGEFDDFNVDDLEGSLRALVDRRPAVIELDTTRVTYLSSTALRALIACHDAAAAAGSSLVVVKASYVVRRLLEVVGLTTMFGMDAPAED